MSTDPNSEIIPVAPEVDEYTKFEEARNRELNPRESDQPAESTEGQAQPKEPPAVPASQPEKEQEPEHLNESQKVNWKNLREQKAVAEKVNRELREELERLRSTAKPAEPPAQPKPVEQKPAELKPPRMPRISELSVDDYDAAMEKYEVERDAHQEMVAERKTLALQEQQQRQYAEYQRQQAQQQEFAKKASRWQTESAELKKSAQFQDFDEVVLSNDFRFTKVEEEFFANDKHGCRVAYHVASTPGEAERILALSPLEQVEALIEIRNQVKPQVSDDREHTPQLRPPSRLPAGPSNGSTDIYSEDNYSAWERKRNQQVYSKR